MREKYLLKDDEAERGLQFDPKLGELMVKGLVKYLDQLDELITWPIVPGPKVEAKCGVHMRDHYRYTFKCQPHRFRQVIQWLEQRELKPINTRKLWSK